MGVKRLIYDIHRRLTTFAQRCEHRPMWPCNFNNRKLRYEVIMHRSFAIVWEF